MALREILKNDTSAETQAALSAALDTENTQSNAITVDECSKDLIEIKEDSTEKNHEEHADVKGDEATEINDMENISVTCQTSL